MTLRVFADERCMGHEVPYGFPESQQRLAGILSALSAHWDVETEGRCEGVEDAIAAVHEDKYIEVFRRAVERGDGLLGSSDNPLSPGTWAAATAAVESTLRAVDWAVEGSGREAFVAVRPP